jgi:hypothetical protein
MITKIILQTHTTGKCQTQGEENMMKDSTTNCKTQLRVCYCTAWASSSPQPHNLRSSRERHSDISK